VVVLYCLPAFIFEKLSYRFFISANIKSRAISLSVNNHIPRFTKCQNGDQRQNKIPLANFPDEKMIP